LKRPVDFVLGHRLADAVQWAHATNNVKKVRLEIAAMIKLSPAGGIAVMLEIQESVAIIAQKT
jgi:hypothetical protein